MSRAEPPACQEAPSDGSVRSDRSVRNEQYVIAPADQAPRTIDYVCVAVVSAATLAFEILLLRVFGLSQWHHFASLAVSLALLGFGAAGTVLVLLGPRAVTWGDRLFSSGMLISGASMVGVFALNRMVQVRPLFAVWDVRELTKLMLLDFAAFLPFFGAGLCVGQVFMRWPPATRRLYAANLFGSGAGSLAAVALLATMALEQAVLASAAAIFLAAIAFGYSRKSQNTVPNSRRAPALAGVSLAALLTGIAWTAIYGIPHLPISDFQRLSYLLDLPDARVLSRSHGVRSMATVVRSDAIRIAPGLSLKWQQTVPSQDALVLGGDHVIPVPRVSRSAAALSPERVDYLQASLGAAPYAAIPQPAVAVLGTSEERHTLQALFQNSKRIVWVESDPRILDVAGGKEMHGRTPVEIRQQSPHLFLHRNRERFDLIFFDHAAAGGDALSEDPLLTVEAFRSTLDSLTSGGLLAAPLRLSNPPRYFPKLMRMVKASLGDIRSAGQHVIALRSLREVLVLVSRQPLPAESVTAIRAFAENWGFDLVWAPDLQPGDINRFHRLPEPVYFHAARAELAVAPTANGGYYSFESATEKRPYFWYSMHWRAMPELLRQLGRQGLVLVDWGAVILVVTLAVAALLGVLLILVPLGRLPKTQHRPRRISVVIYFAALGLGYLIVEMAIFQRSILFLEHPVIAAAIVFATFLIASGVGSLTAPTSSSRLTVIQIFALVLVALAVAFVVLWAGGNALSKCKFPLRAAAVVAALLPLAFAMGRAMPWGLRQLHATPRLIPWAWAINGFASVTAAPIATLISVEFGQPLTWLTGATCYAVAFAVSCNWCRHPNSQ